MQHRKVIFSCQASRGCWELGLRTPSSVHSQVSSLPDVLPDWCWHWSRSLGFSASLFLVKWGGTSCQQFAQQATWGYCGCGGVRGPVGAGCRAPDSKVIGVSPLPSPLPPPAGAGKPRCPSASFSLFTKSHDVHRSQWLWAGNEILCVKNLAQRCSQSEFPWTAEATTWRYRCEPFECGFLCLCSVIYVCFCCLLG